MSRQFKSTDTSKWLEGFGNGGAGSATISGTYGSGTGGYLGACSGTSGAYSLTTPNGWGVSYGGWVCLIHQTQGTGAGAWELNRIMSITTTTSTLKYPLQNTYSTGAQCVLAVPYKNLTVGDLTASAWGGSTGGIIFLLDQGTTSVGGTVTASGKGFRGKSGGSNVDGTGGNGEGSVGASTGDTRNANGSGGGGGVEGDFDRSGGGGGGGNGVAGTVGQNSGANGYGGYGGLQVGSDGLTSMLFGGGGGEGANGDQGYSGGGGTGGGIVLIISKTSTISGAISLSGSVGTASSGAYGGGGGGGAGGSVLIKSQIATLGTTKITASGGAGGDGTGSPEDTGNGGAGAVGRIHLDYVVSYTGTTTPTIDVTQDLTLRQPLNRRMVI